MGKFKSQIKELTKSDFCIPLKHWGSSFFINHMDLIRARTMELYVIDNFEKKIKKLNHPQPHIHIHIRYRNTFFYSYSTLKQRQFDYDILESFHHGAIFIIEFFLIV